MTQPIRGKVARVLNKREIAINIGSDHGVTVDMYFDVMSAIETDIIDPDTGEVLGAIERPKVRVKITHTQEKLSVASTYKSELVNVGGTGTRASVILDAALSLSGTLAHMPPNWVEKYETLEKKGETETPLDEEESIVKTGDSVVQVFEVDEEEEDIGRDLVQMLEEYQRYREAVSVLRTIDSSGLRAFPTRSVAATKSRAPQSLPDSLTLDLLSRLVHEALARAEARKPKHEVELQREPITVAQRVLDLRARLRPGAQLSFRRWIADAETRIEVIVTFLAILELYKSRTIEMQQDESYGDILVELRPVSSQQMFVSLAEPPSAADPGA